MTFLEIFATWCDVCEGMMGPLGAVYDDLGEEVQFVSVTTEPVGRTLTREDVAGWWTDNEGRWPLALDADLELTERLDTVVSAYVVREDVRDLGSGTRG